MIFIFMLQFIKLFMQNKKHFFLSILFVFLASFCTAGFRDISNDIYPEYIIEEGDFLSTIADRFSTSIDAILQINDIVDANSISIGDKIKIPSLKGISGILSTETLTIGETVSNICILSGMKESDLIAINQITSPTELYIGSTLMVVHDEDNQTYSSIDFFDHNQTLIEKSMIHSKNPSTFQKVNRMNGPWDIAEKQLLFANIQEDSNTIVRFISPLIDLLEIKQLPVTQGETHVVHIKSPYSLSLTGSIGDQGLNFFQDNGNQSEWYAFFGIDAMAKTGLTNFSISGSDSSQNSFAIDQKIIISENTFTDEVVEGVDAATLEDNTNQTESQTLESIKQTSLQKLWGDNVLSYPVDEPCLASGFGTRRTYNNGTYNNYHTGVDFIVCSAENLNIYAAADGQVVFAGELPIHGNHTIIDHGWGVYSTYSHQSQILVSPGQNVKRGDLIGIIGTTGRSVGPHLHFEIKINGIYVNPMTWLSKVFP